MTFGEDMAMGMFGGFMSHPKIEIPLYVGSFLIASGLLIWELRYDILSYWNWYCNIFPVWMR